VARLDPQLTYHVVLPGKPDTGGVPAMPLRSYRLQERTGVPEVTDLPRSRGADDVLGQLFAIPFGRDRLGNPQLANHNPQLLALVGAVPPAAAASADPPTSIWTRWWFWSSLAAVAVGAVVVVVATQPSHLACPKDAECR
jgi:hypothetical protein